VRATGGEAIVLIVNHDVQETGLARILDERTNADGSLVGLLSVHYGYTLLNNAEASGSGPPNIGRADRSAKNTLRIAASFAR